MASRPRWATISNCLYVSTRGSNEALPDWFDLLQLRELFRQFEDRVTGADILSSSTLRRVGKVTLKTKHSASLVVQTLNGRNVSFESETCTISVRYWRESDDIRRPMKHRLSPAVTTAPKGNQVSRTLFVKIHNCRGFDVDISNSHLRSHFQEFQRYLLEANVILDHATGKPRGFAFVTFARKKIVVAAIKNLQGSMLNGKHKLVLSGLLPYRKKSTEERKQIVVCRQPTPKLITTLELKDEVVQMLLLQNTEVISGFNTLAGKEGVELTPLPQPRVGFKVMGEAKAFKAVKEYFDQHRTAVEQKEVGYAQIVLSAPYKGICSASEVLEYMKGLKENSKVMTECSFERPAVSSACLQVGKSHVVLLRVVVGSLDTEKVDVVVVPTDRATGNTGRCPVTIPSPESDLKCLYSTQVPEEISDAVSLDSGSFSSSHIIQTLLPTFEQANHLSLDTAIKNSLSLASSMHLGSVAFPGIKTEMIKCLVDSLSSMGPTTLHTVHIVLNTRAEADSCEKALSDLVFKSSKYAGSEKASPLVSTVPPSVSPSASSSGLVWSWKDDDGLFKPYSQAAINELNIAFRTDPDKTCVLKINGTLYGVNFKRMKQTNLATLHPRDIQKVSGQSVSWKYWDDYQRFMSYSPTDSLQIEAMYQARSVWEIVIQDRRYKFDFVRMKQVNVKTGYKRDIQRDRDVRSKISNVTGATYRKAKFLHHDKVVVNFKGPSKSVDEVKVQLEKKLKSLLFSKSIPYPPQASPALLSKLKEVSRQHLVTCTVVSSSVSGASNVSECAKLEGLEPLVVKALTEIQELIINFQLSLDQLPKTAKDVPTYPPEWDSMSKTEQVKIVNLEPGSADYRHVCSLFCQTLLTEENILGIQRVQNKLLWDRYVQTKRELHKKNAGIINEMELFHGTRDKRPQVICESEDGFDVRLSSDGMWGRASYFAVNASYSDSYAYHNAVKQTNKLILVKVLTGDSYSCEPDSSLRRPPVKKSSGRCNIGQIQEVKYDSVNGTTNGSQVYMTYDSKFSYPAYIITYTKVASVAQAAAAATSSSNAQRVNNVSPPPSSKSKDHRYCIIS